MAILHCRRNFARTSDVRLILSHYCLSLLPFFSVFKGSVCVPVLFFFASDRRFSHLWPCREEERAPGRRPCHVRLRPACSFPWGELRDFWRQGSIPPEWEQALLCILPLCWSTLPLRYAYFPCSCGFDRKSLWAFTNRMHQGLSWLQSC